MPRVVHGPHHVVEVLARPPYGETGLALGRVLHPAVERLPGPLEILGLYHLDALPRRLADAVARGLPHLREQFLLRGAQVNGDGGVEVEIVAGVAETDVGEQCLRVRVALVDLGFDLYGVRTRASCDVRRAPEESPDGPLVLPRQPGTLGAVRQGAWNGHGVV